MTIPKIRDDEFTEATLNWSRAYKGANNKYPIMDIEERLREVEKLLLIIATPDKLLNRYTALAEAYNEYKLIERLTLGNEQT